MINYISGQLNFIKSRLESGNRSNKGFSLVEVLVAMIILAIMTLPMLTTFATSSKINANARKVEEANTIAQKVIERCKSLSIDELLDGNGDILAGKANVNDTIPVDISNSATGVYEAKAWLLKDGHYSYDLTMATFNGINANRDADGRAYYKGSNNVNYYVQTILSPDKGDSTGEGTETTWEVNDFSMPAFAEIKDSDEYVLMNQVFKYDSKIQSLLPTRSKVVQAASSDLAGYYYREVTSTESTISKLSGIKKVVVLNINVDFDATTSTYTQKPQLLVKYYRENDADGNPQYKVDNSNGNIIEKSSNKIIDETQGDVFIKKYNLAEISGINFTSKDFKDIYIFYSAYDRKYGSRAGDPASDAIYINMNQNGGGMIPDGKEVNVFIVEQYLAANNSSIDERTAFKDGVQIKLSKANVYINGKPQSSGPKLKQNGISVYSDITGWGWDKDEDDPEYEANNISQNYKEDEERYLYTVTVNIWVAEDGKKPADGTTPYMTLTSTKEN